MAWVPMGLNLDGALRADGMKEAGRVARFSGALFLAATLVACAGPGRTSRAPVEERNVGGRAAVPLPGAAASEPAEAVKPLPGAENAGKPGYFTVRPGDTLIRVGLETGQNWKDLVKWNSLENPNILEVGQVLRVVPPGADPGALTTRPVTAAKVESRPLDAPKPASAPASTPPPTAAPAPVAPPPVAAPTGDDNVNWLWPANGTVLARFDEVRSKGLAIAGKAGDPVLAAADGRVVYAGSGLRGYGNLVILKHNNTYLTAYAHNQALLVKEEQNVKRGQKIAEMGATDADRVKLHFEIRKQGKPVDPERLLPAR
ncbi:peptidoglycan DD-metalloendopeptidase family protein [Rhizobacter sp. LjRoot28]